jgi:hypothetical protein
MQFDEGELRGPIDRDEEMELFLNGSNLGDVGMELAIVGWRLVEAIVQRRQVCLRKAIPTTSSLPPQTGPMNGLPLIDPEAD